MKIASLLFILAMLGSCFQADDTASNTTKERVDKRAEKLSRIKDSVAPFFKPMQINDGDWLESFQESGQTFDEYVHSEPTLPTTERKTIYIQPIGKFTPAQKNALQLTAEYMKAFYDLPVTLNPEKPLGNIPAGLSRKKYGNNLQIRTKYFLEDLLPKKLPSDAAALICFTNYDLYPEDTWNYVFGQASLENRVGCGRCGDSETVIDCCFPGL